jgi:phospholipid/cholesterol/gamma-HCH transport system permease protein
MQISRFCEQHSIRLDSGSIPPGARKLLELAAAVPEKKQVHGKEKKTPFLCHVGNETVGFFRSAGDMLAFIGDAVVAFGSLIRGKALYRKSDLWERGRARAREKGRQDRTTTVILCMPNHQANL